MTRKVYLITPPPALLYSYDPPPLGGNKMVDNFLQSPPPFTSCWLRLIPHENHVIPPESPPLTKTNLSGKIQRGININGSFEQVFSQ